jgi:hypothetical protein
MQIRTKEDWDKVLLGGAVVLWETKYFKIFRMADGSTWRVMPQWRMAWPFAIDNGTMDEIIF